MHFARSGRDGIAYQDFGEGPPTIVAIPPLAQNIELSWEWPLVGAMLERYGSFCRYIHFDKRGTGASERNFDVPGVDQRIDDLKAVMNAAGVERAHLLGVSEGGPMTLLFAASFPDRVEGIILDSTAADLAQRDDLDITEEERAERNERWHAFAAAWGTPDSMVVDMMAPSLADDVGFRRWHERYERQCATEQQLLTLLEMNSFMDATGVLDRIEVPVLMFHRIDDPVIPIDAARRTAAALPDARLLELPGRDHFTYATDIDSVMTEIEQFVTGSPAPDRGPLRRRRPTVRTMGEFAVIVDGEEVAASEWGSRRARQLLKRLAAARGWPVTRDELIELLWPDEEPAPKMGARLSVQLSAVRRVLDGGITADRSTVRLDLDHVTLDLVDYLALDDDRELVATYDGDFLPADAAGWSDPVRVEARARFADAAHRLLRDESAPAVDRAEIAARLVAVDRWDEKGHVALVRALGDSGQRGAATEAHTRYSERMAELDVPVVPLDEIVT